MTILSQIKSNQIKSNQTKLCRVVLYVIMNSLSEETFLVLMIFSSRNSQSPGVSEVHSLCQLWQSWWYWIQCSYDIAQTVMEYKILIFEWHIYLFSLFSLDYDAMPHIYIDFYFSSLKLLSKIIKKK